MVTALSMMLALFLVLTTTICFSLLKLRGVLKAHKYLPAYKGAFPSVSVIRPVKGLDVGAAENFRAALNTGYPGKVETIFVFDSEADPAYKVASDVASEYRASHGKDTVTILVSGSPPKGRTGKLHAMIMGQNAATGELVAFSDSDTRPDQRVLQVLVETLLSTSKAGSAFLPVIVDQPIQKAGDALYALLQNSLYAPWALSAAGRGRSLPFIMGQYMVFTRECLKAIGGVECAAGQLVDDMYIGKCVAKSGYLNIIAPYSLSIVSSGLSLRQFIPIYRKWFQFGKNGLPFSFTWRQWAFCSQFFIPLVLLPLALFLKLWPAALSAICILAFFNWGLTFIHRMFGGSPIPLRFMWAPAVMLLMAPAIIISNRINNTVQWRGRDYKVDKKAALMEEA